MPEPQETPGVPRSDDEWKERVKAEDAAADATPPSENGSGAEDEDLPLPTATFLSLVQLLAAQAMAGLGLVPGPDGKPHKQLAVARHFIDLLSVLEQKTTGQLEPAEATALESILHDLRMAFVTSSRTP